MSNSILDAIKTQTPGYCLAPWKWGNHQINLFNTSFENGEHDNLQLSHHAQDEFQIGYEGFDWAKGPCLFLQQCDCISQALLPAIDALEKQAITRDQFSDRCPLSLRFCKKRMSVPADVVVSIGGVPVLGYNTSVCFRQESQKREDWDLNPGCDFSDETVRAMNMAIIIALAERQAKAVELKCIDPRDVFEVGTIYVPCLAKTIDIYTAKVTGSYLTDLMDPETPFNNTLTITKTVISCANPEQAVTTVLRFMMASVSKIKVLEEMHNFGLAKKRKTRRVVSSSSSGTGQTKAQITK